MGEEGRNSRNLLFSNCQLHHISHDVGGAQSQTWVPNALSLVQAVLGPVISFASDTFQVRKILLMATCTVSFIGAAIAPGANNIYRVIVAQILVGVGFAAVPLAYAIPSEVSYNSHAVSLIFLRSSREGGAPSSLVS